MENVNPSGHHSSGNSALGRLLRDRREAEGLTRTELAAEVGISRQYLSKLESGEHERPSSRVLNLIAKRLNISVEDAYAITGYTLPRDLPDFGPYLRAKHVDWPDHALKELEVFYDYLKYKYSLDK